MSSSNLGIQERARWQFCRQTHLRRFIGGERKVGLGGGSEGECHDPPTQSERL